MDGRRPAAREVVDLGHDGSCWRARRAEAAATERWELDKRFRGFDPHQVLLLPASLDDWLPQDHLARFVADLVDDVLDLTAIRADSTEKRGYLPYDPQLMLRLLNYGYTTDICSSRAIERRSADDIAFRNLAAARAPDSRSISWFRRHHLDALADLFTRPCNWRPGSAWSRWATSPWTALDRRDPNPFGQRR
jgi:transposase